MRKSFFVACMTALTSLGYGVDLNIQAASPETKSIATEVVLAPLEPTAATVLATTDSEVLKKKLETTTPIKPKYIDRTRKMALAPLPDFEKSLTAEKPFVDDVFVKSESYLWAATGEGTPEETLANEAY